MPLHRAWDRASSHMAMDQDNLEVWASSLLLGQTLTSVKQEMGGSLAHKFSTLPSMNGLKAQFIHTACEETSTDILTKWTHQMIPLWLTAKHWHTSPCTASRPPCLTSSTLTPAALAL